MKKNYNLPHCMSCYECTNAIAVAVAADTVNDSDDRCPLRGSAETFAHRLVHKCAQTLSAASLLSTSNSDVADNSDPFASSLLSCPICLDSDSICDDVLVW